MKGDKRMLIRDVERCLVNPLKAYKVFFDLTLPAENMYQVNFDYGPYMELYRYLCDEYEELDDLMVEFFNEKFHLKGDELFPIHVLDNPFGRDMMMEYFVTFVEKYEEYIMELQTRICLNRVNNEGIQFVLEDMPRCFKNIALPPIDMMDHISEALPLLSDETEINPRLTLRLTRFMSKTTHHVIDVLYNPDRYREMEELRKMEDIMERDENKVVCWKTDSEGVTSFEIISKDKLKFNMPTLKQKSKETQKHVNRLDRSQGVDLKHPKETMDDEYVYEERILAYKYTITKMISKLNGQTGNKYISDNDIFGMQIKKIKINGKFKALSKWFDGNDYDVNDIKFKAKFVTYIGTWICNNLEEIAEKCYKINDDGRFIEYDAKIEYIDYTASRLFDMIHKMLENVSYEDDLMYFNEIQTYLKTGKKTVKKNLNKINNINEQTEILADRGRRFSGAQQDITMDSLLKLAYLSATNSPNCKGVVEFNDGYKFRNKRESELMIAQLGAAIMKQCKKSGPSQMFKFFIKCNPSIWTRHDTDCTEVNVGLCALKYYAFIANRRDINRVIERVI